MCFGGQRLEAGGYQGWAHWEELSERVGHLSWDVNAGVERSLIDVGRRLSRGQDGKCKGPGVGSAQWVQSTEGP